MFSKLMSEAVTFGKVVADYMVEVVEEGLEGEEYLPNWDIRDVIFSTLLYCNKLHIST